MFGIQVSVVLTSVFKNTKWKRKVLKKYMCEELHILVQKKKKKPFSCFSDTEKDVNILILSRLANDYLTNCVLRC